jgi:CcmD family protein
MKKLLSLFFLIVLSKFSFSQSGAPEMADAMRSSGKIYVVACVAAIVMIGLIVYLVTIDRKVSKLEREIKSRKKTS